ncbi:hypothetical protein MLGJGCBP_03060 [Rhodococcus sp. T7]|nr:hypothetical protein [Rhodococcus sp. T7]KAF0963793.1 hypothetical protein MLGJGCBP_03060 [Rhodococcus sp. T7]
MGLHIEFVTKAEPLGTAGGIRNVPYLISVPDYDLITDMLDGYEPLHFRRRPGERR